MPRKYTFRKLTGSNLGWHPELREGEGADYYGEWFWLDGQLEGGYQYSMGLFARRPGGISPEGKNWPSVELHILTPDGEVHHATEDYPPESFKPEPWGGAWGHNTFTGRLGPDGMPEGYALKVSVGNIGVDITARAVASGVQFSDEEHGYTYYHPYKNLALAWWPLVPRAEVEGTITIDGKAAKVRGLAHCERQLANLPNAFGGGGQAIWFWGHFYAGDYTAVWTDSAASERSKYRHFTPFVLWKGGDVVLSTYQFACVVEKFGIDPVTGLLYPVVESLRASDGHTGLTAQLLPGKIIDFFTLEGPPSAPEKRGVYFRQHCDVRVQVSRWDEIEEIGGTSTHEFGAGADWFPFEILGSASMK